MLSRRCAMQLLKRFVVITAISLCLMLCSAWGQDDSAVKPMEPQAAEQDNGAAATASDQQAGPTLTPDTNPPTGAKALGLGYLEGGENQLSGGLSFMEAGDTNPQLGSKGTSIGSWTTVSGQLALDRSWKSNTLELQYMAGGFIPNTKQALGASQAHQLGVSDIIKAGRWSFMLSDDAVYAPEGGYGFGGLASAAGQGIGLGSFTGLNPSLMNEQNAFLLGRRVSNTSAAQLTYHLSAHSSVTLVGTYGLLHFMDAGFIDSNHVISEAGYNYAPTRHDTFYLNYAFGQFHFGGPTSAGLKSHSVTLGYTRRVTGRLLFDVAAGPQLISSKSWVSVPLLQLGPFVLFGLEKETFRHISWTGYGGLKYSLGRTNMSLSYQRSAMGGSGLLAGAETSGVQGSIGRTLGHRWDTNVMFGLSHSTGLGGAGALVYNTFYAGANVHRRLWRNERLEFNYQLQRQTTDVPCTAGIACGTDFVRHVFGVGFGWQFRPIRIG